MPKENHPGRFCGRTNILNKHLAGRRDHGPRWTSGWYTVHPRRLGHSVLAVVGLRDRRLNSLTTMLIQGLPGKTIVCPWDIQVLNSTK